VLNRLFPIIIAIYLASTASLAFAQLSVDNPSDKKALSNIGFSSPLIAKISDKGIYNITIKSGVSSIPSGLNFEIVFLNASSSVLDAAPAGAETNTSLDKQQSVGLTVPSVIEHVIPVKSFDITMSSPDGKELLNSADEIPRGGRILENVNLNNYTGNVSISLSNIVPDSNVIDLIKNQLQSTSNQTDVSDSVKIEAEVVKS
jgi:hypothetical protein